MPERLAKNALFDGLAQVAKALGHGRRAELVDVLAQGERSVEGLADQIAQSVANTSHHLHVLLDAGLVRTRRAGTRVYYSLASPHVASLWADLQHVAAEHVAQLDQLANAYLGDRAGLEAISRDDLLRRMADGDVLVVDVRPTAEFQAGHVAGAVSIPVEELSQRLTDLPSDTQVVAYCRGPFCVYADEAVRTLRAQGRDAVRLEDGFPEWARAGHPVELEASGS
jgi:rhodanese-related sulfurtransferase